MSREVPVALPLTHEHDVSELLAAIAACGRRSAYARSCVVYSALCSCSVAGLFIEAGGWLALIAL